MGKSLVGKTTINRFTETDTRKVVASVTYVSVEQHDLFSNTDTHPVFFRCFVGLNSITFGIGNDSIRSYSFCFQNFCKMSVLFFYPKAKEKIKNGKEERNLWWKSRLIIMNTAFAWKTMMGLLLIFIQS